MWKVQIKSGTWAWRDYYAGPSEAEAREFVARALSSGLRARYRGPNMNDWQEVTK